MAALDLKEKTHVHAGMGVVEGREMVAIPVLKVVGQSGAGKGPFYCPNFWELLELKLRPSLWAS